MSCTLKLKQFINILLLAVVCILPSQAMANTKAQHVVFGIVGFSDGDARLHNVMGDFYDINFEDFVEQAKQFDLDVEIKVYPNVEQLLSSVVKGEIDGAFGFSHTPARREEFLFSQPFLTTSTATWYKDIAKKSQQPESLSWACIKGSAYCDVLEDAGIKKIFRQQNFQDAFDAVNKGKVDALISTYVSIHQYLDEHSVMDGSIDMPNWLGVENVSFITTKDKWSLLHKVDSLIDLGKKSLQGTPSSRQYYRNDKLLTQYRKLRSTSGTVNYSTSANAFPFFSIDKKGRKDGFLADYLQLISSRTGLHFNYLPFEHDIDDLSLKYSDINIVPVIYNQLSPEDNYLLTKPILTTKFVAFQSLSVKPSILKNKSAGILISLEKQGVTHIGQWKEQDLTQYDDLTQILDDLKKGVIHTAYISYDVAQLIIAHDDTQNLIISEDNSLTYSIAFSITNNDRYLRQVLNSVIDLIGGDELDKLNRSYTTYNVTYGYNRHTVFKIASLILVIFTLLLLIGLFITSHLKLKVKLAQASANSEEKEKEWLAQIIQEIGSLVFIHNENNQLQMTNCSYSLNSQCQSCSMKCADKNKMLVDNIDELSAVRKGDFIEEVNQITDCSLDTRYVTRKRKIIQSPTSDKKFVLTVLTDITEQKEKELALINAKKKAQTAVRARESFLTTMSHELRTPLSAVHGLLDLLARQLSEAKNQELVTQAIRSLRHLNTLVDEVLDYSKLEANELLIRAEKHDLLALLCDVIRSFEAKADSKGLDYIVDIEPFTHQMALFDATRLTQVITNLLSNAIKFTAQGEIRVYVKVSSNQLFVTVSDTGIGMNQVQIQKVKQPFVQADDTITRQYGGTGLGLSIVERLVQCMRGQFIIESQLGMGTQMEIELPIDFCDEITEPLSRLSYHVRLPQIIGRWCQLWQMKSAVTNADVNFDQKQGYLTILHGGNRTIKLPYVDAKYPDELYNWLTQNYQQYDVNSKQQLSWLDGKVLVAEDNPINQRIIMLQLTELGIKPVIVDNGRDAWRFIQKNPHIELVLTDFHMPEMDGYELVSLIKEHDDYKNIIAIGLTAEDERLASERIIGIPINDILYKPYNLAMLYDKLVQFFPQPEELDCAWLDDLAPNKNDIAKFANVFITSMSDDLTKLKNNNDFNDSKKVVHSIKGGLGAVGLSDLVALCIQTEQSHGQKFEHNILLLIAEIEKEIELAQQWVKDNDR